MKYKRLPKEELEELEAEFVDFLVVNGITAEDWEKLLSFDSEKAEAIIDQFSDVVWEGVLRKTTYLEKREDDLVYLFKCEQKEILLKRVDQDEVLEASKPYSFEREAELFDMIQQGCQITDGALFEAL